MLNPYQNLKLYKHKPHSTNVSSIQDAQLDVDLLVYSCSYLWFSFGYQDSSKLHTLVLVLCSATAESSN